MRSTYINALQRSVVALGIDDLVTVDTADAMLVAAKSHVGYVNEIVADLKRQNLSQATECRHITSPWGTYDTLDEGHRFTVKRILLKPGAILNLQLLHHRVEH